MGNARKIVGLRIDIETRSRVDIRHGVYRYVECPDFRVLLIAYSWIYEYEDGTRKISKPRLYHQQSGAEKTRFRNALRTRSMEKHAFNAQFERVCLSTWLGLPAHAYLDPANWRCTAARANVHGVFGSLDEVARAVRAPIAKDPAGKRLIRLFSQPQRDGAFVEPVDAPQDFIDFAAYCANDVVTEAVVARAFGEPPAFVQAEYEADQRINDRGVRHFAGLSRAAVEQVEAERDRLMGELKALTGLDNPNSGKQMQEWLVSQGYPMSSLDKASRADALSDVLIPDEVAIALTLKGAASLSSVAKHKAALDTRCSDGRIRGSLRFYGAHTGREAGRGIQPQNLPRYEAPAADRARLLAGTAGPDAPLIAKGTVRASLVPARGCVFVVCDYNAIEARVLAWLAGEVWAQAEFAGEGKIYEATAATMFGLDKAALVAALKACGKCGACEHCETRSKGKVSNLALGYAGGAGALVTMGAEAAGIDCGNYKELNAAWKAAGAPGKFFEWNRDEHDYPELLRLRDAYRDASPATVGFWKLLGRAWDVAAQMGRPVMFGNGEVLKMVRDGPHNRLVLPSGRSIWYRFARSHLDENNPDRVDRRTFIGKGTGVGHTRVDTHGGKLCENATQAVARDVLFDLLLRIEERAAAGWPARTVLHVHDEVVLEVPEEHADQVLADTIEMMGIAPAWAPGLLVKGAGGIMTRYGK
jgi:DNA polymerase bacteriophage-type